MFSPRSLALTAALVAGLTTVAHAQDADTPPLPTPAPSGEGGGTGTLGLSLPITLLSNVASSVVGSQARVPTVDIVYFLSDKAAVDIIVGVSFHRFQQVNSQAMVEDQNVFGFAAGVGYRMYTSKNNLRSFIEPQAILVWPETSDSDSFGIDVGAFYGVERNLTPWLSLSGAIGATLNASNSFKDIQLATSANLAANLYWK